MTLKEFKQSLIEYGRTCIPDELREIIRIPGTSESDYMYLQNTKKTYVSELIAKKFRRGSVSTQIANNADIVGIENLRAFEFDKSQNEKEISELFPEKVESEFLEEEKLRVRNNIELALQDERTSINQLIQAAERELSLGGSKFTWVPFFAELSTKLTAFENRQTELINILKSLNIDTNKDDAGQGTRFDLEVIDPFTFYGLIAKHSSRERLISFAVGLKKQFKIQAEVYTDVNGLPSINPMKAWYFPYEYERKPGTLELLWKFFKDASRDHFDNGTLSEVKKIKSIRTSKLTQGLFLLNPRKYFPINSKTRPLLESHGISTSFENWDQYLSIISQVKETFNKETYEISHDALLASQNHKSNSKTMENTPLNQILYGPPGTGKTYSTMEEAVRIVEELSEEEIKENYKNREDLREAYNSYKKKGQIVFITFHQSFTYEDFIEGIKPNMSEDKKGELGYDIVDGIFKEIAESADSYSEYEQDETTMSFGISEEQFNKAAFYKISLGNSLISDDEEIYRYCIDNNVIALGYGEGYDYSNLNERAVTELIQEVGLSEFNGRAINYFKHYLKKDNYVVVSHGNKKIRALGIVTGDYYYDPDSPIQYNHFRQVEWLIKDQGIPAEEFYKKSLSQQTIYKLNKYSIRKEFFVKENTSEQKVDEEIKRNHVLIIDEINRGNIAQIFGELITLIEEDKRKDGREPLSTELPYSKETFSVPSNLYIIGTMNTADRSVEALDTALRRRFSFKEVTPSYIYLPEKIGKVEPRLMLKAINERIEKLIDKDHQIGHSYFIGAHSLADLRNIFEHKVLPLLQEYFFGDIGKIGLILGKAFIKDNEKVGKLLDFDGYDSDVREELESKRTFTFTNPDKWNEESFISIYN